MICNDNKIISNKITARKYITQIVGFNRKPCKMFLEETGYHLHMGKVKKLIMFHRCWSILNCIKDRLPHPFVYITVHNLNFI